MSRSSARPGRSTSTAGTPAAAASAACTAELPGAPNDGTITFDGRSASAFVPASCARPIAIPRGGQAAIMASTSAVLTVGRSADRNSTPAGGSRAARARGRDPRSTRGRRRTARRRRPRGPPRRPRGSSVTTPTAAADGAANARSSTSSSSASISARRRAASSTPDSRCLQVSSRLIGIRTCTSGAYPLRLLALVRRVGDLEAPRRAARGRPAPPRA